MSSRPSSKLHASGRDVSIRSRPDSLSDVSDDALKQLTDLLRMDAGVDVSRPSQSWLEQQAEAIKHLDSSIRRPKSVIDRLAVRMGEHKVRFFPQTARLCQAHAGLDPRVVRNLMLLVAEECTHRTDRYRKWRHKLAYSDAMAAWLDRIDAVTGLWITPEAFRRMFGYVREMPKPASVESGCEACILAVLGSRPQLLADLRANMVERRGRHPKRPGPRLLRVVDAWIAGFESSHAALTIDESERLAPLVLSLLEGIDSYKAYLADRRAADGKPPRKHHHRRDHAHKTQGGIPLPRQPSRGRYSYRSWLPEYEGPAVDVDVGVHDHKRKSSPVDEWLDGVHPILRGDGGVNAPVDAGEVRWPFQSDEEEDDDYEDVYCLSEDDDEGVEGVRARKAVPASSIYSQ